MIRINEDAAMTGRQKAIMRVLNACHCGGNNAAHQSALVRELEKYGHVMRDRVLRDEIRTLRLRFLAPIAGSYSDGYFVAQSIDDLEKNRETVRHHGRSLLALSGAFRKSERLYFSSTIEKTPQGGQAAMPLS